MQEACLSGQAYHDLEPNAYRDAYFLQSPSSFSLSMYL